jgi:hypothetical protein
MLIYLYNYLHITIKQVADAGRQAGEAGGVQKYVSFIAHASQKSFLFLSQLTLTLIDILNSTKM